MSFNFKHIREPFVMLLIGPPLSGKTFFIRKYFSDREDVDIIGVDYIIMDTFADEGDSYSDAYKKANYKEVNRILKGRLEEASETGRNVIVDMTNLFPKRRKTTLSYFGDEYFKVGVIFPILDWDEYFKRNQKRNMEENKFIPENVIRSMVSSYKPISEEEGFDKIVSI